MSQYPIIANHGLIENLQTAALVSTDGNIDWFCASRCNSPSVFGSLLDLDRDGHFKTQPMVDTFTRQR
jgi:GH15 family glucan-1,4-alpha-glucosidase